MSRNSTNHVFFNAVSANGVSAAFFVRDWKNITFDIGTLSFTTGSTVTIKAQGAVGDTKPDFSAAATLANPWTYIQIVDVNTGIAKDGSTGVTIAGADDLDKYEFNTNGLDWVSLELTAYNAPGTITSNARAYNNV